MKYFFSLLIFCAGLSCSLVGQTMPLYENRGVVSQPLNIDATVFLNGGPFDVTSSSAAANSYFYFSSYSTLEPFDTLNTLYYTNLANAEMTCSGGFDFYFQTNGFQYPAAVFENYGAITGLVVSLKATNILNTGTVRADGGGLVSFTGDNVNLSRGGIASVGSGTSTGIPGISYSGETPIYFGQGNGDQLADKPVPMDPTTFQLPYPSSPIHEVLLPYSGGFYAGITNFNTSVMVPLYYSFTNLTGFSAFANTNRVDPTNEVVQVIFVSTNTLDTNILIRAGFVNSSTDVPGNRMAVVEWKLPSYDSVAGQPLTNYLYFTDRFGTQTNAAYRTNFSFGNLPGDITGVNSYNIYKGSYPLYNYLTNNALFSTNLINNAAFTNKTVTNSYVAYAATIGSQSSVFNPYSYYGYVQPSSNPALTDPTNQPGRIEINSDNLDISYTRLKADGMLMINASNLISNEGMVFDSPVVKYNIGSTNPTLVVSNFVVKSVSRLMGDLYAYSAVFTNGYSAVTADGTNDVQVRIHVLILDHYMKGSAPVDVYEMVATATNIVIQDDLHVSHRLRLDTDSLDIRGLLTGSALDTNSDLLFPRIKYLTNSGSFTTLNGPFMGDRLKTLKDMVNHGSFSAQGLFINADTLLNDGQLSAGPGSMTINARLAKLDQGQIAAAGYVSIAGSEIKARDCTINAGSINLTVTNMLSDSGYVANNIGIWSCSGGFNLYVKPVTGDLLGTALSSSATEYRQVFHKWAGEDRGRSVAGFSNNTAIGRLTLDGARFSRFNFAGTSTVAGQSNALYIDYLQLNNNATNLDGQTAGIVTSPNMTLYFAAANLPVEQLDGKLNGHLKWVSDFAGPNSSTNITFNGQTIQVNLGLLTSMTIDSDADGIPNGRDPTPFGGVRFTGITVTNLPTLNAQISWNSAAQTAYNVEFTTNLISPTWQLLTNVFNSASTNKVLSVLDAPVSPGVQRYYRVSYTP